MLSKYSLAVPPLHNTPFNSGTVVQPPISSAHYGRLPLSHSSCGAKARLAPSLQPMVIVLPANRGENPPLHTRPYLAGPLPLSRAVPPDPHGKPSPPHCPLLPSDPFASWATQPTLSLCPLASQATHSPTGHSVRPGRKGRYSNLIRGPLFRERGSSFARYPYPLWLGPARSALFQALIFPISLWPTLCASRPSVSFKGDSLLIR